jgi:hypothetical protein
MVVSRPLLVVRREAHGRPSHQVFRIGLKKALRGSLSSQKLHKEVKRLVTFQPSPRLVLHSNLSSVAMASRHLTPLPMLSHKSREQAQLL